MDSNTVTYGQKMAGVSFNPGGNEDVAAVKQLYAQTIDILDVQRQKAAESGNSDKVELFTVAIHDAIAAQMMAVKAITLQ